MEEEKKSKKGKRFKKEKFSIIAYIILIAFCLTFILSIANIIIYIINNNQNKKIAEEISAYITDDEIYEGEYKKLYIDFVSLKERNSDTVGFLKVNGTDIESVVVQGKDNSFYLSHNFEKKANKAGWIFLDYRNKLDGTDKNIVIYGHNMKNGSMFSSLKSILDVNWYDSGDKKYINFITDKEDNIYQIFSVYQIESEDYYITTDFINDSKFEEFIETIKSRSIKDFNIDVTIQDQILTLSTCANNSDDRIVLHAKKYDVEVVSYPNRDY